MERIDTVKLQKFEAYLKDEERSNATIEKYLRDVRHFVAFLGGEVPERQTVLAYKQQLAQDYAVASANSMLAALNQFFRFCGQPELCVKQFKVQKKAFCPAEKELTKEEYRRLVKASEQTHNERLSLLLQTICATGIRVSELVHITVEAIERGQAVVSCKGKTRTVFIVATLQKKLLHYAKAHHITAGALFVTKSGKPLSRCNIWREMKALCAEAGVASGKVFPHNLRHLFARTFYSMEKDIAKLADILGHTNINTTRIYIVTTGAEHRRKMEQMRLVI